MYVFIKSIKTESGPLRLVKVRKFDNSRSEKGDADFNTDYNDFKKKHQGSHEFELIKRETFEMLRLSDPSFDVMACFSSIPISKDLGVDL